MNHISLEDLNKIVSGEVKGDPNLLISSLQEHTSCGSNSICYLKVDSNLKELSSSPGAVITTSKIAEKIKSTKNFLIVEDPYIAFAKVTKIFFEYQKDSNKKTETKVGKNVILGENVVVNNNCLIGNNVCIHDNVSIYPNTTIGDNVTIHSGVVIGSDGFGFAKFQDKWVKIYHLGGVEIGNDVEIGANSAIDRGVLGNTVLAEGVILDNHVHVAHNVKIGKNTAVAAQTAFAGSVKVGKNCLFGGHCGIVGHIEIADEVTVLAHTLVTKSLSKSGVYSGIMPIQEHSESLKFVAKLKKK